MYKLQSIYNDKTREYKSKTKKKVTAICDFLTPILHYLKIVGTKSGSY